MPTSLDVNYVVAATLLTAAMLAVLTNRLVRPALVLATGVQLAIVVATFPEISNHRYLETFCIAALTFFDLSQDEEVTTLLQFLRWSLVIVFFHTGLQKLLYGTYFDGQFLGYATATSDRFATFFQFFLPAAEFERLRAQAPVSPGRGPFAVSSPLFLCISNLVWLFELLLPPLMLWVRTRMWAAIAAIVFTLGIQWGAHEFMFGLLFTNLALLFLPRDCNRWFVAPLALIYLALVALTIYVHATNQTFFLN